MAISVPWFFPQLFTKDPAIIHQVETWSDHLGMWLLVSVMWKFRILFSFFSFWSNVSSGNWVVLVLQMRTVTLPFLVSLVITPPTLSLEGTLLVTLFLSFLCDGRCMATMAVWQAVAWEEESISTSFEAQQFTILFCGHHICMSQISILWQWSLCSTNTLPTNMYCRLAGTWNS